MQEGIECQFQRMDGYLVPDPTSEDSHTLLDKELDAAIRCPEHAHPWSKRSHKRVRLYKPLAGSTSPPV
jgi:hypothetical protein